MPHSRRKFIGNGLSYVALGLTVPTFLIRAAEAADAPLMADGAGGGAAALPPIPPGKILVVIEMAGGNDGLNTVIPYTQAEYAKFRPTIGVAAADVVKIDKDLGLHPSMKALGDLYEKGNLAVLTGVGYPNPNRSHFQSMDIWQTAHPEINTMDRTGWLARYFDADGHFTGNPLSGLALSGSLPLAMWSNSSPVSVIGGNGEGFALATQGGDRRMEMDTFHDLYSNFSSGTVARNNADFIRNVGNQAYTSSAAIKKALQAYDTKAGQKALYPRSGLAGSLQTIAKLINGGLGTRVFYCSIGGFDTHANQPIQQANQLGQVADAIAAFQRDMALQGRDKDVTVMTFSEFGRRVKENGSAGTDHGAASVMFVAGGAVKGGVYGDYPSLADLQDGDLRYHTDFRRVYATMLDRWLGSGSGKVLNGQFDPLPLV